MESIEHTFRTLSDRTRLRARCLLSTGELYVGDLVALLGVPQPPASRHLAYLRRSGLVESSPAIVGGTLLQGTLDKQLFALDAESGEVRWTFEVGDLLRSSPSVAGGWFPSAPSTTSSTRSIAATVSCSGVTKRRATSSPRLR